MKNRIRALTATLAAAVCAAFGLLLALAPSAHAASLVQISNFGSNPGNSKMYLYVPNSVRTHPAILVAAHQCTNTGPGFYSGSQFAGLADQYGFIVIYPDANRSGQCWDVSSNQALTRNGGSDPVDINSMVQYVEQHDNGDSTRVYVTGASSGGMLTNVLLGDYPDVFKAGSAFMGVPFHCFYTGTVDGWNNACSSGQITNAPQVWGDYVRAAYPGYSGPRPRMQLWHGTLDTGLNYHNFGEEIKQWTNVLGVSQTPSSNSVSNGTWTHTTYGDPTNPPVDAYSIAGVGHVLPLSGMAAIAIHFFGLDGSGGPSPSTSPSPSSSPSPSASPSASPSQSGSGSGACQVTDTLSAWSTGLTENITVANNSTSAINGWHLAFTLPGGQTVTNAWNATISPTSGSVTATGMSYNATIAAGGSTSFGFQAIHTGDRAAPASFTLNGTACSLG